MPRVTAPSGARIRRWAASSTAPEPAQAFRELSDRDRELLVLRFFADRTQTQIAQVLDISQMHVSRLLSQLLSSLRQRLEVPRDLR